MRIKEMRIKNRISQAELGRIVGVERSTICQYETGKRKPDIDSLNKMAEYFNVSVDFLIGRGFEMTIPVEKWHSSLQEDYAKADDFEKVYMEYKYGGAVFISIDSPLIFTEEERALGAGQAKTALSSEEWEWLELLEEIKQKKGKEALNAIKKIIHFYIDGNLNG